MITQLYVKIKDTASSYPPAIRAFLIRSLILFVVWKGLYIFFLAEPRTLDDPLTQMVGKHSVWVLNKFIPEHKFTSKSKIALKKFEGEIQVSRVSMIYDNGKLLMYISDECNGLELFILYFGFIIAMPASLKRKGLFALIGIFVIHGVNILRCVGLSMLLMNWDTYFDLAHHYIFKIMVYSVIFILWVIFTKKLSFSTPNNETVQVG
jgi:exosortase family protein XrtF